MNFDDLQEEISFLLHLKENHKKRLRILKLQQARQGFNSPPEVEIEIREIEEKITLVDKEIEEYQYQLFTNTPDFDKALSRSLDELNTIVQHTIIEVSKNLERLEELKSKIELGLQNSENLNSDKNDASKLKGGDNV